MKVTFFLFFLFFSLTNSIKTREEWNKLFRSNSRRIFQSDNLYQNRLKLYLNLLSLHNLDNNRNKNHLFVVKYRNNCGHICHEFMTDILNKKQINEYHYEIVDTEHGVLRISSNLMKTFHSSYSNYISDYIPFLPELKIEENILNENICNVENINDKDINDNSEITLHIVFTHFLSDSNISTLIKYGTLQDESKFSSLNSLSLLSLSSSSSLLSLNSYQISHSIKLSCSLFSIISLETVLEYYSSLPSVHWIELRPTLSIDTKFANSLTQIDPDTSHSSGNIYQYYRSMNLTGQGQIIGISDTGIDVKSCYFYDPDHVVTYDTINPLHRKIRYYNTYIDSTDSVGHGTTVSGIAAGECIYPLNQQVQKKRNEYDSVAFNAKISFFDISGTDEVLRVPSDINNNLLELLYTSGARIMSMSWGSAYNKYSIDARNVDIFQYNHPETLVLLAAGNSGVSGYHTVGSPATAKSAITVGASLNSGGSWKSLGQSSNGYNKNSLAAFSSRGPTYDGRLKPDVCGVGYYLTQAFHRYPSDSSIVHADLNIVRGTSFSTPLLAAHTAIIREYFMSGYYPTGSKRSSDSCIPSGALLKGILAHSTRALKSIIYDSTDSTIGRVETTEYGDNLQGYGRVVLSDTLIFDKTSQLSPLTLYIIGCSITNSKSGSTSVNLLNSTKSISYTGELHQYTVKTFNNENKNIKIKPLKVTLSYTDMYPSLGASNLLVNDLDLTITNSTHTFYPYTSYSTTKSHIDHLNTLEIVILENPIPDSIYFINIRGYKISSKQSYSLVITGEIETPTNVKNANFKNESTSFLSTAPIYVLISILVGLLSLLLLSLYYVYRFHQNYFTKRESTLVRFDSVYTSRESNLRSFNERYTQNGKISNVSLNQFYRDNRESRENSSNIQYPDGSRRSTLSTIQEKQMIRSRTISTSTNKGMEKSNERRNEQNIVESKINQGGIQQKQKEIQKQPQQQLQQKSIERVSQLSDTSTNLLNDRQIDDIYPSTSSLSLSLSLQQQLELQQLHLQQQYHQHQNSSISQLNHNSGYYNMINKRKTYSPHQYLLNQYYPNHSHEHLSQFQHPQVINSSKNISSSISLSSLDAINGKQESMIIQEEEEEEDEKEEKEEDKEEKEEKEEEEKVL